jgi:hypothetical protein
MLSIQADDYPGETTFEVIDNCDNGKVVFAGGPYRSLQTLYLEETQLELSEYTLTILDSYGDGMVRTSVLVIDENKLMFLTRFFFVGCFFYVYLVLRVR